MSNHRHPFEIIEFNHKGIHGVALSSQADSLFV